ncbi:alpha/beta hydrolase [Bifidobacterium xylocopae]|uniref:Esterase n=1 Tax=Bifidobacterium xylocopae TaxID=2493119 RepID=A0A366KEM8_9BIFI|nr:alpha/beta hydrolase-fold protein [Bifidobacterium xylocopae]RBP99847.1 esterase [Bifidobacterium xylocopae]
MLKWFARIHLLIGWLPFAVFGLAGLGLLALLITQLVERRWKALTRELITTLTVGAAGLLATWLVSDVFMLFDVSLGWLVIWAVAAGFAAMGFVIASLVLNHGFRRVLASLMILPVILATALRVDMIYGEYTTLGSVFAVPIYPRLAPTQPAKARMSVKQWRELAAKGQVPRHPSKGKSYSFDIPNHISRFGARTADIYLPPAALSDQPPALPVFVLLAGQPGSPDRLFTAGGIQGMLDAYASRHNGLAPIVVSPDQNGGSKRNSLCVDSPVYGKAETYLTRDVPDWIKSNLPVATNAGMWAIGGFSQGGTCSTQLAPRHPHIYGAMLPADGELEPKQGSKDAMIRDYFHGDAQAFQAQVPTTAIARHAPSHQLLFTGAGERDPESIRSMTEIAQAAYKAGMDVEAVVAKDSGHDWHAVKASWQPGLEWMGERMGLGPMSKDLDQYSGIRRISINK